MAFFEFHWTDEIIEHLAEHGIGTDDFEEIVSFPDKRGKSRSTGLPCCWGDAADGRHLICIYEPIDDVKVVPVTAYEVPRRGE